MSSSLFANLFPLTPGDGQPLRLASPVLANLFRSNRILPQFVESSRHCICLSGVESISYNLTTWHRDQNFVLSMQGYKTALFDNFSGSETVMNFQQVHGVGFSSGKPTLRCYQYSLFNWACAMEVGRDSPRCVHTSY
jgi:hypothetical protein